MDELLGCLRLLPQNMRRNLDASGQAIAAESAMMALAPALGRTEAYAVVKRALAEAWQRQVPLADALLADGAASGAVDEPTLRKALDPAAYTGRSAAMAHEMAHAARHAATRLAKSG